MAWTYLSINENDLKSELLIKELLGNGKTLINWRYAKAKDVLTRVLHSISFPITILIDNEYLDDSYLDLYSSYYVQSYRESSKFSCRILIFERFLDEDENLILNKWFSMNSAELSHKLVAEIIINDNTKGNIGIAYVRPDILLDKAIKSRLILEKHQLFALGKNINIMAFPFRQLDGGPLSCAEVAILNIMDFYSSNLGFHKLLPSDILKTKDELTKYGFSNTHGMGVSDICNVLQRAGLQTITYMRSSSEIQYSIQSKEKSLWEKIYHYIDSGYPCIALVRNNADAYIGHCFNGIGIVQESDIDYDYVIIRDPFESPFQIINASDINRTMITMDDRRFLETYGFENNSDYVLEGCIITVPKEVILYAEDAYTIAIDMLSLYNKCSVDFDTSNPLITKILLADSTSYVRQRVSTASQIEEKRIYAESKYPKYIWICELATEQAYKKGLVNCEIILDATSRFNDIELSVVSMRIGDVVLNRELAGTGMTATISSTISMQSFFKFAIEKEFHSYKPTYLLEI